MSKHNGTTKLRFAALRRVSTEQQEKIGESLRTQTTNIEKIVQGLGSIVGWYGGQEHATPGHEKKEVERLLADAQKQRFDVVIVNDPDRWSRDNTHSKAGLEILRQHGIRFFTGSQEWDLFNPSHKLFLGMSAEVGEFFAGNQKRKSLENRIERAKRGIPTGGKLPYGRKWVWDDPETRQSGKWKVDPDKQRIIQDCAKRYLSGESMEALAKEYKMNAPNLHKVLTRVSGTEWQVKFEAKDLNISETVAIKIPALLDDETIEAVRGRAKANRTYGHGPSKHPYLFARMIQCAHCGYAMFGQTNHNKLSYYRHAHTHRDKACTGSKIKTWIPAAEIEDAVMRHLFETFGNPAAVQRAMEEARPNNERVQEALKRLEAVTKEVNKLEASRQRILDLVVEDSISKESAKNKLNNLKEREQKLKEERTRLDDELAHIPGMETLARVAKDVSTRFRPYASVRVMAKTLHANTAFDEMTWKEKRQLCQMVFSGILPDGQRMGVFISWDKTGKKWRYRIEGHLIDASGPIDKKWFTFGAAHLQKDLVNSHASG